MPASPITVKLDGYPSRWKWKQQIILADEPTGHFYRIYYYESTEDNNHLIVYKDKVDCYTYWMAELHCCNMADNPSVEENWYQVEELCAEHKKILDTIDVLFDITIELPLPTFE